MGDQNIPQNDESQNKNQTVAPNEAQSYRKFPSYGEKLVRCKFNPSNDDLVETVKKKFAEIADIMNGYNESRDKDRDTQRAFSNAESLIQNASSATVYVLTSHY